MSSSALEFVRNAIQVAGRAVTFDREGNYQVAIYFYHEALALLQRAIQAEPQNEQWKQKAQEYSDRDRIQVLQDGDGNTTVQRQKSLDTFSFDPSDFFRRGGNPY